jgi:hypothetical protein
VENFVGNTCSLVYRASDNTIIFAAQPFSLTVGGLTRTGYLVFDIGSLTIGGWHPCGITDVLDLRSVVARSTVRGNGMVHICTIAINALPGTEIFQQPLSDAGVLGTNQSVDISAGNTGVGAPNFSAASDGINIVLAWWPYDFAGGGPTVDVRVFTGASAAAITFTEKTITPPHGNLLNALAVFRFIGGTVVFLPNSVDGLSNTENDYTQDTGSGFGAFTDLGGVVDIAAMSGTQFTSTSWGVLMLGTIYYWEQALILPPATVVAKATMGGGTFFPRFINKTLLHAQIARVVVDKVYREFAPLSWLYDFPNDQDICLSREWRLYNQIDPTALACARKPDCFSGEEGARSWVEPPYGAVTFNPDKAISLPAPAATNVVVLSFRVPIAYDGILLAQYHVYRGQGTFIEASGDIIWRVRVNGRYLRDMGNMQLSIGSPQTLSPCPGGLWLHSGDLVEYVVSAPNGSGSLPLPGQGNILAGLHGWYWPRT